MGLKTFSTIIVFSLAGLGSLQLNAQTSPRPRIR